MSSQDFGNESVFRQEFDVHGGTCVLRVTPFCEGVVGLVDSRGGGGAVRHALRRYTCTSQNYP